MEKKNIRAGQEKEIFTEKTLRDAVGNGVVNGQPLDSKGHGGPEAEPRLTPDPSAPDGERTAEGALTWEEEQYLADQYSDRWGRESTRFRVADGSPLGPSPDEECAHEHTASDPDNLDYLDF